MDPEKCLLEADSLISDGEEDRAAQRLDDYVNWRGMGGYEPLYLDERGDEFHKHLIKRYEAKFGPYLDGRLPE